MDSVALSRGKCRPELLLISVPVVLYYPLRALNYIVAAAVIDIQVFYDRTMEILRELLHYSRSSPPEAIHRLIIVTHGKYVLSLSGQHLHNVILDHIYILELIYEYVPKLVLPHLKYVWSLRQ